MFVSSFLSTCKKFIIMNISISKIDIIAQKCTIILKKRFLAETYSKN